MSVILYGPKGFKLVDPYDVKAALNNGWSLSKSYASEPMKEDKAPIEEVKEETDNKLLKRLNLDALSDDEIRATAKRLKIANWYNKGIDRLKGDISAA